MTNSAKQILKQKDEGNPTSLSAKCEPFVFLCRHRKRILLCVNVDKNPITFSKCLFSFHEDASDYISLNKDNYTKTAFIWSKIHFHL